MAPREPIHIPSDGSDLARLLEEASAYPVLLMKDGVVYRLSVLEPNDEESYPRFDPEAARVIFEQTAGSWSDIDADKVIEDLYEWRRLGSRPAWRPKIPKEWTDDNGF